MTARRFPGAWMLSCAAAAYGLTGFASPNSSPGAEIKAKVAANVQVSIDRRGVPHFEVVIAADPKDSRFLLVGSRIDPHGNVAYATTDGGRIWSLSLDRRDKGLADPTVAFGPDGTAYYADLTTRAFGVAVFRSKDHGVTWSEPVRVQDRLDRPYLAVDCGPSRFAGRVFLCSNVNPAALTFPDIGRPLSPVNACILYTSDDAGRTFTTSLVRLAVPPFRLRGTIGGVVMQDGRYLLPYEFNNHDVQEVVPGERPRLGAVSALRLGEGGRDEIDSSRVAPEHAATGGDGIPTFAADLSNTNDNGHVYGVWSEVEDGRHRVRVARSVNNGLRWSRPRVISGAPDADSFMPSVAVNRDGIVGVCWYDTRHATPGNGDWDVYFRASLDGGETWEEAVRVTDKTSRARVRPGLGDTAGMAADGAGVFHPVWVDQRTGILQVWTAAITVRRP